MNFQKLPYYQLLPNDGRSIIITPFFYEGRLIYPSIINDEIQNIEAAGMVSGHYFSKRNENTDTDIFLPLFDIIPKRIASEKIIKKAQMIESKIVNFGVILEKYKLISSCYENNIIAPDLISAELEFLFGNVRSLFDQLQQIIAIFWNHTMILDTKNKKMNLPHSFSHMALTGSNDSIRQKEEIVSKYGLPMQIAEYYERTAPFFRSCKIIREKVIHFGESIRDYPIYKEGKYFVVDSNIYPYSQFKCWQRELLLREQFGSVQTLVAFNVQECLQSTIQYVKALFSSVEMPESISQEWYLFIRHPCFYHFNKLHEYINQPWDQ